MVVAMRVNCPQADIPVHRRDGIVLLMRYMMKAAAVEPTQLNDVISGIDWMPA